MVKICRICEVEKPLTEYHRNSGAKDGLDNRCNECRKVLSKEWNSNRNNVSRLKYSTPHDKCVYAFKKGKDFVYIGESDRTPFRLFEHLNCHEGRTFAPEVNSLIRKKDWTYHILWYGDNDEYRKSQEKELIKLHQPKYNKTYKNG